MFFRFMMHDLFATSLEQFPRRLQHQVARDMLSPMNPYTSTALHFLVKRLTSYC